MSLHPEVKIGHIHLTVSNLERSLAFYCDILRFDIVTRYGDSAVFLSAGGYHHHIGLNTWAGEGAPPQPKNTAGLYHFAILYPSRKELAQALQWLIEANYPITGASDHGVSEAVYLSDPDGIGVELYADRPKDQWKVKSDGEVEMITKSLDLEELLGELNNKRHF